MRNIAILTFLSIATAACGTTATTDNKPEPVANKPANTAANTASVNDNTNTASTAPVAGVKVTAPSDHKFGSEGIPKGWKWIDPDTTNGSIKFDTAGGTLKFTVPTGKDMFGDNRTAPHMVQPIDGDFQIETRVKFDPKADYQGAGLFIYIDGNNYVRLERAFGGLNGGGSGIRLDARTDGDYRPITSPSDVPTDAASVDLRVLRTGKIIYAFWRADENAEWKEIGDVEYDFPTTVQAGIIACNTGPAISVEFSYIKLAPAA